MVSIFCFLSLLVTVRPQSTTCLEANGCQLISGGGPASVADQIQQWGLFFQMQRPDVNVEYTPTPASDTLNYLLQKCVPPYPAICFTNHSYMYDYGVFDYDPSTYLDSYTTDNLIIAPIYSVAIVLAHKVASFASSPLYLSRDLIYKIFNFEITNWNHTEIAAFNQQFYAGTKTTMPAFPNAKIQVVLRSDANGITQAMNQFMYSYNQSWGNNTETTWGGWNAYGNPNAIWASESFAHTNAVLTHANSIGYVPLSYALTAGLSYATLQNKRLNLVQPDLQGLGAAMENTLVEGESFNVPLADADGDQSYPLSSMAYFVVLKRPDTDCAFRSQMFKFWNWCLSDPGAIAHASANPGFANLTTALSMQVLNSLSQGSCLGVGLLAATYDESSSTPGRIIMTIIAVIFMLATIVVFFLLVWKKDNRITKATGLVFAGLFLFGCFWNFLGVAVWALVPLSSNICNAQLIVVTMGCSLCMIAMFVKTWSIYNVWTHMPKGETSHFEQIPNRQLIVYAGLLVAFQVLLFALWLGTTPGEVVINMVDPINIIARHTCKSGWTGIWQWIEMAFLVIFCLWNIYLANATIPFWTKHQLPNESQNILSSTFNGIFWSLVILPMIGIIQGSPETTFFLIAIALLFPTGFALISIFLPKLFFIFDTNTANPLARFLAGTEPQIAAGYRAPAHAEPCDEVNSNNQNRMAAMSSSASISSIPESASPQARTIRIPELPTVEEKEAKKDSPLVWYRQLDPPVGEGEPIGTVVSGEARGSGRNSPSKSDVFFSREVSEIPDASQRLVASTSLELVRVPITEEE